MVKIKVDDPLDAFAVHGACGFWGVLANALFADPVYSLGFYVWGPGNDTYKSCFFGGYKMLGSSMVALFATIAWVCGLSIPMFLVLKLTKLFRVSEDVETTGMDTSKHGGSAYNY